MADQHCAFCTQTLVETSTNVFCKHCAGPGNTRWYCSALCGHNDLLAHNENCTRIALMEDDLARATQAGVAGQALFYTFIEHTWAYDMHSVSISQSGNDEIVKLQVIHGANTDPKGPTTCQRTAGNWLFKFPRKAFKSISPKIKEALLADHHSVWAFVFMNVAVQILFEGEHTCRVLLHVTNSIADLVDNVERDIKEVVHYLPGHARRLVQHLGGGTLDDHRKDLPYPDGDNIAPLKGVYRITLSNGSVIALDLAGAQYGLPDNLPHETVMPWADYMHRWVNDLKYRIPLHAHHNKHAELMQKMSLKTHLTLVTEQTAAFNDLLKNCEFVLGFELEDLPYETGDQFIIYKRAIITAATDRLLQRPRELDAELAASIDPKINELECLPPDLGPMFRFEWSQMSKMIQITGGKVRLAEKKLAKDMKKWRCVYKMPGDWKMMFIPENLPSIMVSRDYVSENPGYGKKK